LLSRRGRGFWERPHAILELENDHSAILTRRPNRAAVGVKMDLRGTPIGIVGSPLPKSRVIGSKAWSGAPGGIEVSNFARVRRVANVKDSDPGIEHPAGQCRRVLSTVDTAVVTVISKDGQAYQVG
jgi:hypothetical protein